MNWRWLYPTVDETWKLHAACKDEDPELFFPEHRGPYNRAVRKAQQICGHCPVRTDCLHYALVTDTLHGIWGGVTAYDRAQLIGRKRVY